MCYIYIYIYIYEHIVLHMYIYIFISIHICPTQSIKYVHFLVNFRKLSYLSFSTKIELLCGGSDAPRSWTI